MARRHGSKSSTTRTRAVDGSKRVSISKIRRPESWRSVKSFQRMTNNDTFLLRKGNLGLLDLKWQTYPVAQSPENGSYGPSTGCGNFPSHELPSPPTSAR